jgi:O-antigen/teichoic acid export membrane protein
MGAEPIAVRAPGTVAPAAHGAPAARNLTRRASLNAVASLLDYFTKAGVSLVVTPLLVSGLGRSLFGIWEMLSQLTNYLSPADARPSEALRLIIAQRQTDAHHAANRRSVGAALAVWLLMLPLIATLGAVIAIFVAPALTHAGPGVRGAVQLTTGLLALTFILAALQDVPESALSGMNLGYKRMGLQASINILHGALAVAAVWLGLGVAGLGMASVIRIVVTGIFFWLVARRFVHWLGVDRPTWAEVKSLFGMSAWISLGEVTGKVLLASDLLVLGAVVSPAVVTTYVLTGYTTRLASGIHTFATGAAMPGIGGLLGAGRVERAAQARRELHLLTWLFITVGGGTLLLWNHAFLARWVGAADFAGPWVNLLLVLSAAQAAFIRNDSNVIDAALRPRQRVMVAAAATVLTLGAMIVLTRLFGMIGLCAGLLAGRAVQSVAYPVLVRRALGRTGREPGTLLLVLRLGAVTAGVLAGGTALGARLTAPSWPALLLGILATVPLLAGLALYAGAPGEVRRQLQRRIRALIPVGSVR